MQLATCAPGHGNHPDPLPPLVGNRQALPLQVLFGLWSKHGALLRECTSQIMRRFGANPPDLEQRIVVSILLHCAVCQRILTRVWTAACPVLVSVMSARTLAGALLPAGQG